MKWITVFGIAAVLGIALVAWQEGVLSMPEAQPKRAAAAQPDSPLRANQIFAAGFVEGRRPETRLNFEISGRLVSVATREGTRVKRGEIMARLDDSTARHQLSAAKAQLCLARAERKRLVNGTSEESRKRIRAELEAVTVRVKHARKDLDRAIAAYRSGAITAENYDNYLYRHETAQAELSQSKARVAEAEAKARLDELEIADAKISLAEVEVARRQTLLEKSTLRAPGDGVVLQVNVEPGEWIGHMESARTQPAFILVDNSVIHVRAYVEELEVLSLHRGMSAQIKADGLPDKVFQGIVTRIAPSVRHKRHRHHKPGERVDVVVREVLIRVKDPGGLLVGLPVEVFIDPAKKVASGTQAGTRTKRNHASRSRTSWVPASPKKL